MAFTFAPFPLREPPTGKDGLFARPWIDWFNYLTAQASVTPTRLSSVSLTGQVATIAPTSIPLGQLDSGMYRVTYYTRITTVDGVSSSLTVTLGWTDGGVACSLAGVALTGNTTATVQTGTALIRSDHASPLTYSTTYVSNTPGTMAYSLDVVVESVAV